MQPWMIFWVILSMSPEADYPNKRRSEPYNDRRIRRENARESGEYS